MGHLYYVSLCNQASAGCGLLNTGPFTDLSCDENTLYWMEGGAVFGFGNGFLGSTNPFGPVPTVWAVRDLLPGDLDSDGDGVADLDDNCSGTANANQSDLDQDGVGDVCDNCPSTPNTTQFDFDRDGVGGACDCNDSIPGLGACNTPESANPFVFVDSDAPDLTIQFPNITATGNTTVTEQPCDRGSVIGFTVLPRRDPVCYDIETTAEFGGKFVVVCIAYDDTGLTPKEEAALTMVHCKENIPLVFTCDELEIVDHDTDNNTICALTTGFSVFYVGLDALDCDQDGRPDDEDNCRCTRNPT